MPEPTADAGLRERLLAALDADALRPRGERIGLVNAMLSVAEQHVASERAKTLNEVRTHLDEIVNDWDRLNVPQVAAVYELLRRMDVDGADDTDSACGVEGCDDCEVSEAMELATELAEERILHQATIAERDLLTEEINGYRQTASYHAERSNRDAAAVFRVRAECDRIEAAVRDNATSADLAGGYLGCLRHIRAALDGSGEA